jgi:hypothetical protein
MTNENYANYKNRVFKLLNIIEDQISPDVLNGVSHYLNHAEIEMAFELLCLEVIDKNISLNQETKNELLDLAKNFKLDIHSTYEPNFWEKLRAYVSSNI